MITRELAECHRTFYHISLRNRDGSAVRCRANGKLKTWKRRPDYWELPVKHGLRQCFYLCPHNANVWLTFDLTELDDLMAEVGLAVSTPIPILADKLEDMGHRDAAKVRGLLV